MNPHPSVLAPALYLVCLGIVYGSLFPFQFSAQSLQQEVAGFLASWRTATGIGDILGNLALFFPYGYIASLLAARAARPASRAARLMLFGLALAAGCQLAQLFTLGRDPSLFDLYMNILGGALGWMTGRWLPLGSSAAARGARSEHHLPLVLAALWLASQLLPFVPSIDLQAWRDALKPLFYMRHWYWQEVLFTAVCWLVFLHLLSARVGLRLRAWWLPVGAALVLVLRVVIVENRLTPAATLALLGAIPLWWLVGRRLHGAGLAVALLVAFALDVLSPLVLRAPVSDFGWLPFVGYLQGSMLVNAAALSRKLFVFGALALLLVQPRRHPAPWAVAIATCLLSLEIGQRYIGYGTPTLTDPLLFLITSWFVVMHGVWQAEDAAVADARDR